MEFEANLPSLPPEIKRMPAALHGFDRGLGTAENVAHEDWPISCQSAAPCGKETKICDYVRIVSDEAMV